MTNYLLVDIGSTYTKLTAVNLDRANIIGTAHHYTTVETDVRIGYEKALEQLVKKTGTSEYKKIYASSSAAGGLKMAAIGLVEELTVEAAKRVCLGAGGKVDLVYSHELTMQEALNIKNSKIDIILLAGGTDGGNRECVLHNAKILGEAGLSIPIVYAGNKSCQDEIGEIFKEYKLNGWICKNVMPRLNKLQIDSAREVIKNIFLDNIVSAKGIKKIEEEIDGVLLPTPRAVLRAAELFSKGYLHESGLGEIVIVDVGGATTDIYSIATGNPKRPNAFLRGLEEPFAKRTVEGDLGMRLSAPGIINNLNEEEVLTYLENGVDLKKETLFRNKNSSFLPQNKEEKDIDHLLGSLCADIAFSRHVGSMETIYTPLGVMYYQSGKDLTDVKYIVGTGGVIIHDDDPLSILKVLSTSKSPLELRPKTPEFLLDKDYILSAMGLLSIDFPEIAIRIMKKRMEKIE
ncbi:MAG: methylaspartate mutase accessory protein GlmL [Bacilli bacterium]|nr:methylaspartate mutase accessory protein GlmL [Bacilli bacterium]